MLIDKIEAIPVEVPLRKVFSGSGCRIDSRCTIVTRIHTADGLVSEVYNGDNRAHGRAIAHIVEDEPAPLLIGEDAAKIERLWAKMFRLAHPNRDRKLVMEALACVAIKDGIIEAPKGPGFGLDLDWDLIKYRLAR
jgi:D-galactarolactone cycloisomerase